MYCSNCGEKILVGAKKCTKCGQNLIKFRKAIASFVLGILGAFLSVVSITLTIDSAKIVTGRIIFLRHLITQSWWSSEAGGALGIIFLSLLFLIPGIILGLKFIKNHKHIFVIIGITICGIGLFLNFSAFLAIMSIRNFLF